MNSAPKPRPTIATRTFLSDMFTAYRLPPTAYRLPPTAYWLLPTAYCLLPTAYCLLRATAAPTARRDDIEHAIHRPPVRRERADVRVLPDVGRRPELRGDRLAGIHQLCREEDDGQFR